MSEKLTDKEVKPPHLRRNSFIANLVKCVCKKTHDLPFFRTVGLISTIFVLVTTLVIGVSNNVLSDEGTTVIVDSMAEIVAARIKPKNPVAQEELSSLFAVQKNAAKLQLQRISFWVSLIATLIAFLGGLVGCLATWRSFTLEREIETRLADSVRKINTQESEIVRLNQDLKEHNDHFQRIHGQDIFSIAEGYLLNMAVHKLKFPDKGPTQDRISLYSYDESEEKCFVRLGRFSYNRAFMLSGRKSYPANQGCIAKAWHEGIHFDNGIPDRIANRADYYRYHQNAQLKREEIQALSMNSRLYFGYRILNKELKALAVIVVESTEPNRFTRDHLQQIFDSETLFLSHLIGKMSSLLPQPGVATRLGF